MRCRSADPIPGSDVTRQRETSSAKHDPGTGSPTVPPGSRQIVPMNTTLRY
ncbi:b68.1 [miniopterid betaherpesvirus 1]|uniref:B68.1 n=1 Tax=miniopterid betaherpesvirus 1 TaxID=3070189 RepID=I3VQ57_9BETA|nr:b68.1 [miniopterid betaherpesvirus 1]AFK83901.1 b68.1 [miniopterid betaherpesvirus 1]